MILIFPLALILLSHQPIPLGHTSLNRRTSGAHPCHKHGGCKTHQLWQLYDKTMSQCQLYDYMAALTPGLAQYPQIMAY